MPLRGGVRGIVRPRLMPARAPVLVLMMSLFPASVNTAFLPWKVRDLPPGLSATRNPPTLRPEYSDAPAVWPGVNALTCRSRCER
jgi:hypothetical protein